MTYYLLQRDGENFPLHCKQCLLETLIEDSKDAQQIHEILNLRKNCDKIPADLIKKYPNMNEIIDRIFSYNWEVKDKYWACKITDIFKHFRFLMNNFIDSVDADVDLPDFTLKEIKPAKIFHEDDKMTKFAHISNEYEVVNTWTYNPEFIEYLLEQGITMAEHGHNFMALAIEMNNLEVIDYLINAGIDINYKSNNYDEDIGCDFSDYADLASMRNIRTLKHVLDRGCRYVESAVDACSNNGTISEIMPYFKFEEMSLDAKSKLACNLIFNNSISILKQFEKLGYKPIYFWRQETSLQI